MLKAHVVHVIITIYSWIFSSGNARLSAYIIISTILTQYPLWVLKSYTRSQSINIAAKSLVSVRVSYRLDRFWSRANQHQSQRWSEVLEWSVLCA